MAHADRPHSKWGMSVLYRYILCPGSVRVCEEIGPQPPSAWALEGTRAHELLEQWLTWGFKGCVPPVDSYPKEMRDAVGVAVDYIVDICDEWPDAQLSVETEFEIPSQAAPGEVWGINDICIYIPSLRTLYVIDYKHGAGVAVETVGNKQVRGYGLGALSSHPEWVVDTVVLVIIQPRIFNFSLPIPEEWVPVEDIHAFGAEIDAAIRAAQAPDAPLVPGEKQCRFCAGKTTGRCPALQQRMLTVAGETFADVRQITKDSLTPAVELSNDRIGYILEAGDLVKDYIESVRNEGFKRAMSGTPIPGRKLVEALAKRTIDLPPDATIDDKWAVGEKLAECAPGLVAGQFLETDLVGVGAAEKLIKDAAKAGLGRKEAKLAVEAAVARMAFLTTKKSSGTLTLVADSDPRPAVNRASTDFGGVIVLPEIGSTE